MREYLHKRHNITVLMYRLVFPAKYRRVVFDAHVDDVLKEGSTHGLRIADCGFRCARRGLRRGQLGEIRHTRPIRARQAADIQLNSSDIAALCGLLSPTES